MAAGLLLAASAPRAELAGRFFFAPQERAALDALRNTGVAPGVGAASGPITVNGLVSRSSGKSTIWINQVPQRENENPQGVTIQQGKTSKPSAVLLLPSGKKVEIKPGQTFDAGKGKIREGYQESEDSSQGAEYR